MANRNNHPLMAITQAINRTGPGSSMAALHRLQCIYVVEALAHSDGDSLHYIYDSPSLEEC